MATEYRFIGLRPRTQSLGISVGIRHTVIDIPLSERELIDLIAASAISLDNMRKEREARQ